jgi:hypothetical protein
MRGRDILAVALVLLATACAGGASQLETTTTTGETTITSATTTTTSTTIPEPTTTTTAVKAPSTESWGTWTLILASIEVGEPGAEEQAREIAAGLEGAAVLFSDDYPSLNPGYWVVYKGEFPSGRAAGNGCGEIPDDLTCYPRYLGPDVSPLAAAGHALVIDGQSLVIVDVATGEHLKVIDPFFNGDGMWVNRMSLDPEGAVLYYDVGWEDSWYSCESSQGQVEMLRLGFGTTSVVAPGFSPSVSPDGQWLALLVAGQCLPDPAEPDFWVLTPPDTVVVFSLASETPQEVRRWRTQVLPGSYDDPNMVTWVDWRADSQVLVVANYAGDLIEVPLDHQGQLFTGTPLLSSLTGSPRALLEDTLYVVRDETPEEWGGFDILAVDLNSGDEGEVITQTVGWPVVAADTTRTRLIWGSDTQVGTAQAQFGLQTYLGSLAW